MAARAPHPESGRAFARPWQFSAWLPPSCCPSWPPHCSPLADQSWRASARGQASSAPPPAQAATPPRPPPGRPATTPAPWPPQQGPPCSATSPASPSRMAVTPRPSGARATGSHRHGPGGAADFRSARPSGSIRCSNTWCCSRWSPPASPGPGTAVRARRGQRWFHLAAQELLAAGDLLHWTVNQTWNFMCVPPHHGAGARLRRGARPL